MKNTKNIRDGIRRFDFQKKPIRPTCIMSLAKHIISWPDLKRRNFKLEKIGMEGIEDRPYLLLVTHSSTVDFSIMLKATHPHPVNNVMTLEGFNTYSVPLMRSLGVLGTRKFIKDVNLIKNIKYCIDKLETIFALYPEARYSLDGCTSFLPDSTGKLIKLLNVPVVTLKIHGNFITYPQWNRIDKGNHVEATMTQIITAEDCKSLSVAELNARVNESFIYDDYKWQYDNKIVIDHPKRAKGLHNLLYKCPSCQTEHEMVSEGTMLWCKHCNKSWEMDIYGRLKATEGETEFPHIPDWSNWERACVRKEIEDGTYYFEDEVRVETLPNALRFRKQGMGKFIQTPTETRLECICYGKPFTLVRSAKEMDSIHIEYNYLNRGDCVDISIPDDSFWCYLTKPNALTKLSFATEEMYKFANTLVST